MNFYTLEQSISTVLRDTVNLVLKDISYATDNDTGHIIERVVEKLLGDNVKVQDLWGPEWSVFLALIATKVQPKITKEAAKGSAKEVLYKMIGNSNKTPSGVLGAKVGLSADDVDRVIYAFEIMSEYHYDIATEACNELTIPTPEEVSYIYTALGKDSNPEMAEKLCRIRPVDCRPITKADIPVLAIMKDAYLA